MSWFLILVGFIVSLVGGLFLGASLTELVTGTNLAATTPSPPGILITISLFFALVSAGGVFLIYKNAKKIRERKTAALKAEKTRREKQILGIISKENGKVTPLDIATRTELSVDEARTLLDDLSVRMGGDVQVTQDGGIVYVFDVSSRNEKDGTKRITDS